MPEPIDKDLETLADEETVDILEMSDEDFAKLEEPGVAAEEKPKEGEEESVVVEDDEKLPAEPKPEEEQETVVEVGEAPKEKPAADEALDKDKEVKPKEAPASESESTDTDTKIDKESDSSPDSDADTPIDYEAEYKKITAPFKANGGDMTVQSTDDAVRLMQMGANYHQKMAGMKPAMRTLKLLEKNGLMDEEQLNYLIDLKNQNPDAIAKLIKDSKIDPLDINVAETTDYKPTQRSVSDTELEIESVLEEIRETPSYGRTLNVITKDWDDPSRSFIANAPHIIPVINGHMQDGTFDEVMKTVNYERSLGRLQGVNDFDAYKQVGETLDKAGKLPHSSPTKPKQETVIVPAEKTPEQIKAEADRKERKKAAAPVKAAKTPAKVVFNPLEMSDEEFAKFDLKHFANQ